MTLERRLEKLEANAMAATSGANLLVLWDVGETKEEAIARAKREQGITVDPENVLIVRFVAAREGRPDDNQDARGAA
jgi:hypothetical protein